MRVFRFLFVFCALGLQAACSPFAQTGVESLSGSIGVAATGVEGTSDTAPNDTEPIVAVDPVPSDPVPTPPVIAEPPPPLPDPPEPVPPPQPPSAPQVLDSDALIFNREIYPVPHLAAPVKNGTVVDPTFGTKIFRVTNASDGSYCANGYSYWPTFNANSTRLYFVCDDVGYIQNFDPVNLKLVGQKFAASSNGMVANESTEDPIWSSSQADVMFVHKGSRLLVNNVSSKTSVLIRDFFATGDLPQGGYFWQMSKSANDDVFAFTKKNNAWQNVGYLVYSRSQNKVLLNRNATQIDEVQIDKTGKFLAVKTGMEALGQIRLQIWNLQNGSVVSLATGAPHFPEGHSDNGTGFMVGADNYNNQINIRSFAEPTQFSNLLSFNNDWSQGYHISMLAKNEAWALISSYSGQSGFNHSGPYHDEIFLLKTDGSEEVRRVAHHHSVTRSYEDMPKANISQDGRFVSFVSNWNGVRRDLYVVALPVK